MATAAPIATDELRDAAGFGGIVPSGAVAHGGETLVAALAVEHHADGFVVPLLVLSGAPGLIEWDPSIGFTVRDDRGDRYEARLLTSASGLGQLTASVWVDRPLPPEARRLELVLDGLARVNPTSGAGRGVSRPVAGGPWNLVVDLLPERTVVPPPAEPAAVRDVPQPGSVPVRAHAAFVDVVPVGQARIGEGVAVCVMAIERYWDRSVATIAAMGTPGDDATPPAIGRAEVAAWDDRGNAYRVAPVQGASRGSWSEVAMELSPAIPPDVTALGLRVSDVPRGADAGRRSSVPGPFTFGIRLPAA